jgi:hypothetical protein
MTFLRYSEATVDPNRLSLWLDVLAPRYRKIAKGSIACRTSDVSLVSCCSGALRAR